jgi:hypothetical protein
MNLSTCLLRTVQLLLLNVLLSAQKDIKPILVKSGRVSCVSINLIYGIVISAKFDMRPCDERTSVADTLQSIAIPLFAILPCEVSNFFWNFKVIQTN